MAATDSTSPRGFYLHKATGRFRVDFRLRFNGSRVQKTKLLPKNTTEEEAQFITDEMRAHAMRELTGLVPSSGWREYVLRAKAWKHSWFHTLWISAAKRSAQKKRAFSLTHDDLAELLIRTDGKCEVTGVSFADTVISGAKMRPLIPSIDRKNSAIGYHKDNCRIVCAAVNMALFNWGEELFKSLAIGYVVNQVIAPHAPIFQVGIGHGVPHPERTYIRKGFLNS